MSFWNKSKMLSSVQTSRLHSLTNTRHEYIFHMLHKPVKQMLSLGKPPEHKSRIVKYQHNPNSCAIHI